MLRRSFNYGKKFPGKKKQKGRNRRNFGASARIARAKLMRRHLQIIRREGEFEEKNSVFGNKKILEEKINK